jgi:hypothetical protein
VPTYGGLKRKTMKRKNQGCEVERQDNICEVKGRITDVKRQKNYIPAVERNN